MNQADSLKSLGFEIGYVRVDNSGLIDMDDLAKKGNAGNAPRVDHACKP